jgi:hypothetical protein
MKHPVGLGFRLEVSNINCKLLYALWNSGNKTVNKYILVIGLSSDKDTFY